MDIIDLIKENNLILERNLAQFTPRAVSSEIDWEKRLILITGPKGVGKTTLLLQRLVSVKKDKIESLYISLDHPLFSGQSLLELAKDFSLLDGKIIFIDEVHKYPEWSTHVKAIYDTYPNIKLVLSGSSAVHINKGKGDLSRRAFNYKLPILSFREFLQNETSLKFTKIDLKEVLRSHLEISQEISKIIKPIVFFKKYLEYGAYPFYKEDISGFNQRLISVINYTLESDLVLINAIDPKLVPKLRTLLKLVSSSVPFVPKITNLAAALELSRPTVLQYLEYLKDANLIRLLHQTGRGYQTLIKPEKIYLDNPNLMRALALSSADIGNMRETFFASQLAEANHLIEAPHKGDFLVDQEFTFEIGGKNKKINKQLNNFVALDDLEIGNKDKIPLWLFGFGY